MARPKKIRVLVTAGPTWMRIDRVRILTNLFSGRTGFLIAKFLKEKGFPVTLLLGPARFMPEAKGLNLIRFKYFEELRRLIKKELKDRSYKVVIHSAAVSDYKPLKVYKGKISSSQDKLLIELKPAPKIIKEIRKLRPDIYLIQFKLEAGKTKNKLIDRAYRSLLENNSDLVIANDLKDIRNSNYRAYLVDREKNVEVIKGRRDLAQKLFRVIKKLGEENV
ncbi:MAG: hypothetical protein J7K37_05030 [Candidatus Omnitrophica bacterium]|nr:hypothetical protein [Candidatus Omnitrophota bacterium]